MNRPAPHLFLKSTDLFGGLGDELLEMIYASGEVMECGPGQVLFEEGSPGFDLFVVKEGVVEVLKSTEGQKGPKVVSFLADGDCVGEMSVITGQLRSATVRVPERAIVFRLSGQTFDRLVRTHAEIPLSLARTLAYRLQAATEGIAQSSAAKHLAGDLEFFDLMDVCQSLNQGRRTGLLRIRSDAADQAWLYFTHGEIEHARLDSIRGADAVLCIFRHRFLGSFEFEASEEGNELAGEPRIEEGAMGLFLEAARQRDEIEELSNRLPTGDFVFEHAAAFPWTKPDPQKRQDLMSWHPSTDEELLLARRVWASIAVGLSIQEIRAELLIEELKVLQILWSLLRARAIR